MTDSGAKQKRENPWFNIGFNIAIPSLLLIKGKALFEMAGIAGENADTRVFVFALLFPLAYGVWDLAGRRKFNIFSAIGVASVLLTGGIGLMKMSREWIIAKEGLVPLALGAAVLATAATRRPLAKIIMLNDSVVDLPKIEAALDARGTREKFDAALRRATLWVAGSFLLSSVLNFALASYIFRSEAGTEAFNAEVGRMTALSFPVIALPTMAVLFYAMYRLFGAMGECTGLSLEEAMLKREKK